MAIRLELTNESGSTSRPAIIFIYDGDRLLGAVLAENRTVQGADLCGYPAVHFKPIENLMQVPCDFI